MRCLRCLLASFSEASGEWSELFGEQFLSGEEHFERSKVDLDVKKDLPLYLIAAGRSCRNEELVKGGDALSGLDKDLVESLVVSDLGEEWGVVDLLPP